MEQPEDYETAFEEALTILRHTPKAVRDKRRSKIVDQIEDLERELQLMDSLPDETGVPHPEQIVFPEDNGTPPAPDIPNKPRGLLLVIGEHPNRTWKLSHARDVMVERGWLQAGEKGTHQIQNTAWKLKSRGDLKSPRTGHYRITPQGQEAIR